MRAPRSLPLVAIATACLFALACDEGPTEKAAGPLGPEFAKGGKPGSGGGTGSFPITAEFGDLVADNIRSDGGGPYVDGVCGVAGSLGNLDDLILSASDLKGRDKKNCGAARTLIFDWNDPDDDGALKPPRDDRFFMNIDGVATVTGIDELRKGQFNVCNRLVFDPNDESVGPNGSDLLLVSFDDQGDGDPANDEWTVSTQVPPNDKGFCVGDGRLWHMPFSLTVRRK